MNKKEEKSKKKETPSWRIIINWTFVMLISKVVAIIYN